MVGGGGFGKLLPLAVRAFRIYERLKNIPKCRKYDGLVCFARNAINITGRKASNTPSCTRDPYLDSDFGTLCFWRCGYGPSRARLIARTHRITNWIWPRMWVPVHPPRAHGITMELPLFGGQGGGDGGQQAGTDKLATKGKCVFARAPMKNRLELLANILVWEWKKYALVALYYVRYDAR